MKAANPIVEEALRATAPHGKASGMSNGHLGHLCSQEVLTHEEETALFRAMNLLKYQADRLRRRLDPAFGDEQLVKSIEAMLRQAHDIRDHIIKANVRLVVSISKKFVTPQISLDDLLSDGIFTLMKAVEKFDFDRGFRFSTYAYRSIARDSYRNVVSIAKQESLMTRDAEEWAFEQEEDHRSSSMGDIVWSNLRELTNTMLGHLDRRERFIIRSRYALGSHHKSRSFKYLGDKLGVSKERARQLERRAVSKLQAWASEYDMDDLFGAAMV
jgi:RNA polymerase primary sigma factor